MTATTPQGGDVPTPDEIARRVEDVRRRIAAAGGDLDTITIVAVTKGFGPDLVASARAAGLVDLGENYAQELVAKAEAAEVDDAGPTRWHAIGRLQRNKVRLLAPLVHLWQSVDRPELAVEIGRRAPSARVLVQVNVSGEPRQGGCSPDDTASLVEAARATGCDVQGLMAVGAVGRPDAARPGFRLLSDLADTLDLNLRSMGMSGDFEVAVEEGSNLVRVGTALFGPRVRVTDARG